ncbi:MAG: SurA N-terminal domain-containing protein [Ardenticatenaceae bacterium]|nr:SurA N-terminal domain-containing protein [Ardenticatenaceae bacterium]
MTKKSSRSQQLDEAQRESRKEILRKRREAEQKRRIRLAVGGVVGLLLLVFLVAVINEVFVAPNRAVATVNGEAVTVRQFQDRVEYERAQRIISLENQFDAFGGDVGIIQQFSSQTIIELQDAEVLAESVLTQMTQEVLIRQEAEARGITVSDAEVDAEIGSFFNYYDGGLPTPLPTATATVQPTPSLTPIPTAVITDVLPTSTPLPTPTLGPTLEPQPTATAVSKESFDEQLGGIITDFKNLGVNEAVFRDVVRLNLYADKLMEALGEENNVPTEAMQASIFLLTFDTQADADEAMAMIEAGDFLTVWNTIRSTPADPNTPATATASELLWRTQDALTTSFGEDVANVAFTLPPNVPSTPIEHAVDDTTTKFYILEVSGREVRPLSEAVIQNAKQTLLQNLITEKSVTGVEILEVWRNYYPSRPVLDTKFLAQPTATPALPDLVVTPAEGQ